MDELLRAARGGDADARCELGRRYLIGSGVRRHVPTGLGYLRPPGARPLEDAAVVIADALSLADILRHGQEDMLQRAAAAGHLGAKVKLAARLCSLSGGLDDGIRWFERAAARGHPHARRALQALGRPVTAAGLAAALRAASPDSDDDALAVALMAARAALSATQLHQLVLCVQAALQLSGGPTPASAEFVLAAAALARSLHEPDIGIDAATLRACLELQGHACDRACTDAWRCLYRLSAGQEAAAPIAGTVPAVSATQGEVGKGNGRRHASARSPG